MARPKKQFPPKKKHRITIRMTEDMYFVVAKELRETLRLITGSCIKINKAVEEEYR